MEASDSSGLSLDASHLATDKDLRDLYPLNSFLPIEQMKAFALVCIASALVVGPCYGLLFRSASVIAHWDTWGFYEEESETFWAFALITEISPGAGRGAGIVSSTCALTVGEYMTD
jgi:hypothetical protein